MEFECQVQEWVRCFELLYAVGGEHAQYGMECNTDQEVIWFVRDADDTTVMEMTWDLGRMNGCERIGWCRQFGRFVVPLGTWMPVFRWWIDQQDGWCHWKWEVDRSVLQIKTGQMMLETKVEPSDTRLYLNLSSHQQSSMKDISFWCDDASSLWVRFLPQACVLEKRFPSDRWESKIVQMLTSRSTVTSDAWFGVSPVMGSVLRELVKNQQPFSWLFQKEMPLGIKADWSWGHLLVFSCADARALSPEEWQDHVCATLSELQV